MNIIEKWKFKSYYKTLILQVDMKDCGVAALASIAKFYGSDHSLTTLRKLAQTSIDGTSALEIVTAAQALGFDTQAIKADMSLRECNDVKYPFIAHVIKQEKYSHYYVVYQVSDNYIIIGDPDPSVKVIKPNKIEFEKEWTGVALFSSQIINIKLKKKEN